MNKYIYPLIENPFSDDDIIKGIKVLKSKQLTLSKETKNFEKRFTVKLKSNYYQVWGHNPCIAEYKMLW